MLRSRFSFVLCALLLAAGRPAAGDNRVASGQFDEPADIEDWTVTAGDADEAWLYFEPTPDESACVGSGSALLVTSAPGPREVQYSVCAGGLTGGEAYAVGLKIHFPHGPSEGWLFWGVTWFDQPDCTGTDVGSIWVGPAGYEPGWHAVEFRSSTFPEVASARLELSVTTFAAPDPLYLNVDRVFVRPAAEVFADGFELGETCRWRTSPESGAL